MFLTTKQCVSFKKAIMKPVFNTDSMPALFVGHGSPLYAMGQNEFANKWQGLGHNLPKPKAIMCISAHWETCGTMVTAHTAPPTIHDFGGFPKALYDIQYSAPGNYDLAQQLSKMSGSSSIALDTKWGLDHGSWCVLRNMFPAADIPVIQLSLDYRKTPHEHYALAKDLAFLRKHGVLIVGSGNIVHNLHQIAWDKTDDEYFGFDWALSADEKIKTLIIEKNASALIDYTKLGKDVQLAVPSADHYLPLLYVLAMQSEHETTTFFNEKAVMGSLTMTSFIVS